MEKVSCLQCKTVQPKAWQPGDLCSNCGHAVREEVRCAWCAKLGPKGNFCKHCGNKVQPDKRFAAARMLKSLGVDQLRLTEQLELLSPEQIQSYEGIYNRHLAVVHLRVEEVRLAEKYLVQKGYAGTLENRLIPQLPFTEDEFKKLNVSQKEGHETADTLLYLSKGSPIDYIKPLARLAHLRCASYEKVLRTEIALEGFLVSHIRQQDEFSAECALVLGHWKMFCLFLTPLFLEKEASNTANMLSALLNVNRVNQHAALAILGLQYFSTYRLGEKLREEVISLAEDALRSSDSDLRFSAAILLKSEPVLAEIAAAGTDQEKATIAIDELISARSVSLKRLMNENGAFSGLLVGKITWSMTDKESLPAVVLSGIAGFIVTRETYEDEIFKEIARNALEMLCLPQHITQVNITALINAFVSLRRPEMLVVLFESPALPNPEKVANALRQFDCKPDYFPSLTRVVQIHPFSKETLEWIFTCIIEGNVALLADAVHEQHLANILFGLINKQDTSAFLTVKFMLKLGITSDNDMLAQWMGKNLQTNCYFEELNYCPTGSETIKRYNLEEGFVKDFFDGDAHAFICAFTHALKHALPVEKVLSTLINKHLQIFADMLLANPQGCETLANAIVHSFASQQHHYHLSKINAARATSGEFPLLSTLSSRPWERVTFKIFASVDEQHVFSPVQALNFKTAVEDFIYQIEADGEFLNEVRKTFTLQLDAGVPISHHILSCLFFAAVQIEAPVCAREFCSTISSFHWKQKNAKEKYFYSFQNSSYPFEPGLKLLEHLFGNIRSFCTTLEVLVKNSKDGFEEITKLIFDLLVQMDDRILTLSVEDKETFERFLRIMVTSITSRNRWHEILKKQAFQVMLSNLSGYGDKAWLLNALWNAPTQYNHFRDAFKHELDEIRSELLLSLIKEEPDKWILKTFTYLEGYYLHGVEYSWLEVLLRSNQSFIAAQLKTLPDESSQIRHMLLTALAKSEAEYFAKKEFFNFVADQLVQIYNCNPLASDVAKELNILLEEGKIAIHLRPKMEAFVQSLSRSEVTQSNRKLSPEAYDLSYSEDEMQYNQIEVIANFTLTDPGIALLCMHLPYYRKDRKNEPVLLDFVEEKAEILKSIFKSQPGTEVSLLQKLYEIITDAATGPEAPFPAYGEKARALLILFAEGSFFIGHYLQTLKHTLATQTDFCKEHKAFLSLLVDELEMLPRSYPGY